MYIFFTHLQDKDKSEGHLKGPLKAPSQIQISVGE